MKDHIKIKLEVPREDAYIIVGISNVPGKDKIHVGFGYAGELPDDCSFEMAALDALVLQIISLQTKQKDRKYAEKGSGGPAHDRL